ncbi:helix-turn-helix domain-containing protein [Streptomyces sp. BRA346]|uniref:helix-turn-helix domain-containing protein n=1 Tax=Streptomyces sp. BRA346 TaxID=2878199 RepID=UPI00406335D8
MNTHVMDSEQQWRQVRDYLNLHRFDLSQVAVEGFTEELRVAGTPLLAQPEWLPASPVPLEDVHLTWSEDRVPTPISGAESELDHIRPCRENGTPYSLYADAVEALARPKLFQDRQCYRLLGLDSTRPQPQLHLGRGRYFDVINICEAAAHEFAAASLMSADNSILPAASAMPFRSAIGDPTDLSRRPVMAAISTLTIRHDRTTDDAQFILHWRDPQKVATGGGLHQVMPVGMFQPSHDAPWNTANDFDLWRSIVRELSEELLGTTEDYGSDSAPINYEVWPFNMNLQQARRSGDLRVSWLGLGIDPLTFVCDMLTVVVADSQLFDRTFSKLAATNDEGHLVAVEDGTGRSIGIPFRADHIKRLTTQEQMQPAGAALLRLAWKHRAELLKTS